MDEAIFKQFQSKREMIPLSGKPDKLVWEFSECKDVEVFTVCADFKTTKDFGIIGTKLEMKPACQPAYVVDGYAIFEESVLKRVWFDIKKRTLDDHTQYKLYLYIQEGDDKTWIVVAEGKFKYVL